jgi:hypothetical protein
MSPNPTLLSSLHQGVLARRHLAPFVAVLALAALPCCAEAGMDEQLFDSSVFPGNQPVSTPPVTYDASSTPAVTVDASTPWTGSQTDAQSTAGLGGVRNDGGSTSSKPDASSSIDAGRDAGAGAGDLAGLGGLLGGLFGDAGAPPKDAGFTPPPDGGGAWKLNEGSFVDCPAEPPPIPIIGGLCAGIYYGCGWTSQSGQQYSCICDWVHWLCI